MMKRIPSEVWMSLGDLQPSRPLGEAAIEGGVGVVRGATNYHSH